MNRGFSIFMAEAATDADLDALDQLSRAPVLVPVDVAGNRLEALRLTEQTVDHWRANGMPETKLQRQRQALAWRVLQMSQTAANQNAIRAALDAAAAPRP